MAKSLLFQWEDSPSLRHHCGFCDRPLSHPGARQSCFGTHSEPCSRFHQAMFMRNRGHTCSACIGAEQAHHKRHREITELLQALYGTCGENMYIDVSPASSERCSSDSPAPSIDHGGYQVDGDDDVDPDASHEGREAEDDAAGDGSSLAMSRKEKKKEARRLKKAAARPKLITQQDIGRLAAILHPATSKQDVFAVETSPRNVDEIDEIERNLRYNAQEYNTNTKRAEVKSFGKLQDAAVDFEKEINRIFGELQVDVLVKRINKTQVLEGRHLVKFQKLISQLKSTIIEDLVLIKKDEMEVRMRRAGFLRYTNRAAYDIIEDRHKTKDWKTGEVIRSDSPDSNFSIQSPNSESDYDSGHIRADLPSTHDQVRDDRHLDLGLTPRRVDLDSDREDDVAVPKASIPSKLPEHPTMGARTLRILPAIATKQVPKPAGRAQEARALSTQGRHSEVRGILAARPSLLNMLPRPPPTPRAWPVDTKATAPFLQVAKPESTSTKAVSTMNTSGSAVCHDKVIGQAEHDAVIQHGAVSQKKAKKKRRETERKARRKQEVLEEVLLDSESEDGDVDISGQAYLEDALHKSDFEEQESSTLDHADQGGVSVSTPTAINKVKADLKGGLPEPSRFAVGPVKQSLSQLSVTLAQCSDPYNNDHCLIGAGPVPMPTTTVGKWSQWETYSRHLIGDILTGPVNGNHNCHCVCPLRTTSIKDCTVHDAGSCSANPLKDRVKLVYPRSAPGAALILGKAVNRARGQKLLKMYNEDAYTKGRLMLIDDDICQWIVRCPISSAMDGMRIDPPPPRLWSQYTRYGQGYPSEHLIKQEHEYDTRKLRNEAAHTHLHQDQLEKMLQSFEPKGRYPICYCGAAERPDDAEGSPNIVVCAYRPCKIGRFHKSCLNKAVVESVSKWYCFECHQLMFEHAAGTVEEVQKLQ